MRRRHFRMGALLLLSALPLAAFVKSCGFSARIDVIQIFYDKTQFVSFGRCDEPGNQNKVDILFNLITGDQRSIAAGDALLPSGANGGIRVAFPEPFQVEGQAGKTITATLNGNTYNSISKPGSPRAYSLLMDNSRSLDGFDENTGARINLTDPGDARIAGAQNFFSSERFLRTDQATLIAFHGDGTDGVFPKGLVVGRVTAVQRNNSGMFLAAGILPAVDSTKLEELLVVPVVMGARAPSAQALGKERAR